MNIKQAKEQIKNAMIAYFSKDELGGYMLPLYQQRPVFLMGPPGIGKTAIMEQVAGEMGVALLSYSMTHHTRQSALGLPFIVHKKYSDGMECDVSEYTMSEIIASIYDLMEETGKREGILFLDEINCVSETLAPVMLQFLQYKVFGRHPVPDGWIVVTAGNPPEYNSSVREFDIVTWDRLKRIDVEPDYGVWKEYAVNAGVHPAILTYLDIRSDDFYKVETSVEGKSFVTARGWEDLSHMIRLSEHNTIKVDGLLIGQYLQNKKIAREFAQYYDLFRKYCNDYQIDSILDGRSSEEIMSRARRAKFDERLALIGLIMDAVRTGVQGVMDRFEMLNDLQKVLVRFRMQLKKKDADAGTAFLALIEEKHRDLANGKKAASLSTEEQRRLKMLIGAMQDEHTLSANCRDVRKAFEIVKKDFDGRVAALKKESTAVRKRISNVYKFLEAVFGEGQEVLILTTELTAGRETSAFIAKFGCEEYFKYNKDLLLYERQTEIQKVLKELDLQSDTAPEVSIIIEISESSQDTESDWNEQMQNGWD